jgi:DNA polymerase-3 subunit delta
MAMTQKPTYRKPDDPFGPLRASLAGGEAAPLYLVHGNEPLLADRAVEMIARAVSAADPAGQPELNREVFSGEEADARTVALSAAAYPMLGSRRLVIVRDAEKLGDTGPLEAYAADPSPRTTLVVVSRKPDFRKKFFQVLKERAVVVECKTPYDDRISAWIEGEARSAGKPIDAEAAELLRLSVGGSLADIANELEKLYTYAGARAGIAVADVEAVVGVSRQFSVYDLQRALGALRAGAALGILGRMIDAGENMTRCVAQLTHYFEKLWVLPTGGTSPEEAAALLGVKPFFVREYLSARRNFTPEALDRCFTALRDADLAIKTSAGTPRRTMTLLVHAITRGGPASGNIHPQIGV